MQKNIIENLSKNIAKLPGMGPRIAKRIVLHLSNNKEKILSPLIENLSILREKIHNCDICGNLDEGNICGICLDQNRNENQICIVEEVADLWAIERAQDYRGKYHVLGCNLSAISGNTIEDLNLASLLTRLKRKGALSNKDRSDPSSDSNLSLGISEKPSFSEVPLLGNEEKNDGKKIEVIIATSATIDGQTTAHFLAETLQEFNVKLTRLAYGIPVGSELDYLDEGTISIAFKARSEFV